MPIKDLSLALLTILVWGVNFAVIKVGVSGVPPMLLGIPGDNTYANFAEANRVFWRQTIVPLVLRIADALALWLEPHAGGNLALVPDLDQVEALAPDRDALWKRVNDAGFLTADEKRQAVGYGGSE